MGNSTVKLKLHAAWSRRIKLWAEGVKLRAEGDKLRAEGDKLWAEGVKLRAESDKLWAEAILATYGNITLRWTWNTKHGECHLSNGDVYSEDQGE